MKRNIGKEKKAKQREEYKKRSSGCNTQQRIAAAASSSGSSSTGMQISYDDMMANDLFSIVVLVIIKPKDKATERKYTSDVIGAIQSLFAPIPRQPPEMRVRIPSACQSCKKVTGIYIDQRRNDAVCTECGHCTFLAEGTFDWYTAPSVRGYAKDDKYKQGIKIIHRVGIAADLASHTILDACDLYAAKASTMDTHHADVWSVACMLWVAYDIKSTKSLQRRFVTGLQANADLRAKLPKGWKVQDCDYDRWTDKWSCTRFLCEDCNQIFSTRKECMHHAPCNSSLHTRFVPRYVPLSTNVDSTRKLAEAVANHIRRNTGTLSNTMQRREIFDGLGLYGRYVFQKNFHMAVDDTTKLVREDGKWMRKIP